MTPRSGVTRETPKILAMNLAAMVRNVAQLIAVRRCAGCRHDYPVCASAAVSAMKNRLVLLLLADPPDRQPLLKSLIQQRSSAVDAICPDRSFPHQNPGKLKPGFHPAYKRAA